MAIEIPDWLKPLASIVAGQEWPEGDEDLLRVMRDGWAAAAQGSADVQSLFTTLMQQTPNPPTAKVLWTGDGATAFMENAKKFVEGDKAYFPSLQKVCQALSDACGNAANEVEYGKLMIIATLIITAAFIAYALAMAAVTLGGSTAAIPVAQAGARVAIQQIFRMLIQKLLAMGVKGVAMAVLKQIAISLGISLALDAGIQGYQMAAGNRKDWDLSKTKDAAIGGVVDGVVSAASLGIAKGATRGVTSTAGQLLDASVRGGVRGALEGVASTVGQAAVTGDLDKLSAKDIAYGASGGVFGGASDLETGGVQGGIRARVDDMRTLGVDAPDGIPDSSPRVDGSDGGGTPSTPEPTGPRGGGDPGGSGGPSTGSPGASGNFGGDGGSSQPRQPAPNDSVSRQSTSTIDDLAARTAQAPPEPSRVQGPPAQAAPQSFGPIGSGGPVNSPPPPAASAGAPAPAAQPRAPLGATGPVAGPPPGGVANPASPAPGRGPSMPEGGAPARTPDGGVRAPEVPGRTPSTPDAGPNRATGAAADTGAPRQAGAPDPGRTPGTNTPPPQHPVAAAGGTHAPPRTDAGPVPPRPHGAPPSRPDAPPAQRPDGAPPRQQGAPPLRADGPAAPRPDAPPRQPGASPSRPDAPPAQRPDGAPSRADAPPQRPNQLPPHTDVPADARPDGSPNRAPENAAPPRVDATPDLAAPRPDAAPPAHRPADRATVIADHGPAAVPHAGTPVTPTQRRHAGWGLGGPSQPPAPPRTGDSGPHRTPDREVSYKRGAWHSIQLPAELKARLANDPRTVMGRNIHADDRPHIRPTDAGLSLIRTGPLPDRTVGVAVPDPDRFTVEVHGDRNGVWIGDTPLSPKDLADILRGAPGYVPGTPVRLLGCDGSALPNDGTSFASRLAQELGVPVLAPTTRVWVDNFGNIYAAGDRARLEGDPSAPRPSFDDPGQWVTNNPDGSTVVHDSPFPPGHQPEWVRTDPQTGHQYNPEVATSRGAWTPWDSGAPPEFRNPGGPGQNNWHVRYDAYGDPVYGHMANGQFVPHTFRDAYNNLIRLGEVDQLGRWIPNHVDPDGWRRPNGHYDDQGRWIPHGRADHAGRWIPVVSDGHRFFDTGRWVDQPGRPPRWEPFFPPAQPTHTPGPPHTQQHTPPRPTATPPPPHNPPPPPHNPAPPRNTAQPPAPWRQPPPATPPRTPEPPRQPAAPWTAPATRPDPAPRADAPVTRTDQPAAPWTAPATRPDTTPRVDQAADPRTQPDPATNRPADPPDVPRHYFPDNSATPDPEPEAPVTNEHGEAREPDSPPDYDNMPRLEEIFPDEGVPLDEDAARAAFGEVYNRQYGDYRIEVTEVSGGAAHLTVQGAIFDVNGREVGGFRRTFSRLGDDGFAVEHSSLHLRRAIQGQGLAAMFNRDMEGYYRHNGVEFIYLKANSDVGSYTWARADYEFSHHRDVQQTIMPRLRAGIAEAKAVLAQMEAEHQRLKESQDIADQRRAGELERQIRWHNGELLQAQEIMRTLDEANDPSHPGYPRPREIADLFRPRDLDPAQSRNVFWMGKIVLMEPGAGIKNPVEWHGRKYLK
ncbi:hypothetical protein ABZ215_01175 [Amycolatopsis sp. NPDC006131]|uniref:WXG100-like domain-containing protein n=1 Tax=Amycolatopsis sp. NPDC006131 TaxID=3156731 RepID=UPI0033A43741